MIDKINYFLKSIYLILVKKSSERIKQTNEKIVFLLSFPETSAIILEELYVNFSDDLILCYTAGGKRLAEEYQKKGCDCYSIDRFSSLINHVVPITKSSRVVFCDNYFAFLAGIDFCEETSVVQLWHANGAIKLFGLNAKYVKKSSEADRNRYKQVYKKYTHYVLSSKIMSTIFEQNYKEKFEVLPFGYPPTDLYFEKKWVKQSKEKMKKIVGDSKKIVLYVPTYREKTKQIPLNFAELSNQIGNEYEIFVKLHPHEQELQKQFIEEDNVITDFQGVTLTEMLPFVDCLITDYSSIPFEYSLANPNGKIIFYCYDLLEYKEEVGLEEGFEKWAPGKIVTDEQELVKEIINPVSIELGEFNSIWNEYVDGNSRKQLIDWVKKRYGK